MAQFELNVKVNGVEQVVSTIGGLEQALAATNQQLTQVEENSKEFGFLTNQAQNLETVMTALSTDAQQFSTNLDGVNQSATKLNDTFTETVNASQQLGDSKPIDKLNKNIDETVSNSQSLRTELRKVTQELQNLDPGSARFQELSVRAGELRDQIADTNSVVTALAGSTGERLGRALGSTVQIGIAGFQGLSAVTALFGVDAAALEPTLVRLTALLNLSQAIETFGGLGDKITEITAGFQSLVGATETAAAAAASNTAATTAETAATVAAGAATTGSALANSSNAAANEADAAASLQDAAAKTAEATATNSATVATTGLGLAMKALPIVAIVAALATLTYGIYNYVTSNSEASKEEEKRKKLLEEQKKQNDAAAASIAKESSELVGLLYQLKATNAGSVEREKLIKKINDTYGTTFTNLKNESDFQEIVNSSIKDYIALQTVKYKLQANEDAFQKKIASGVDAERQLLKLRKDINANFMLDADMRKAALGDYEAEIRFRNKIAQQYQDVNLDRIFEIQQLNTLKGQYQAAKKQYDDSQASLENLTKYRNRLLKEERDYLDELFPKRDEINKKTKAETKSVLEYTAAQKFALEIAKQRAQEETNLAITKSKATQTLIDDIETERKIQIDALNDRLTEAIKSDTEEVKNKQKAKSEKESIDKAYTIFLKEINDAFDKRVQEQGALEVAERKKTNDELIREYAILQQEIKFGDQNTLDSLETINQRRLQISIDQINAELENNNLSLDEFETLQNAKAELQAAYNRNQAAIDIAILKNERDKDLINYKEILENRLKTTFTFNDDQLAAFTKLQDETNVAFAKRLVEAGILEKQRANESEADYLARLDTEALAFANLQQTKINLDKDYASKAEEINAKTNIAIAKSDKETAEKTFEVKVQLLQDFFAIATDAIAQFSTTTLSGYTNLISSSITAIGEIIKITETNFETSTEKVVAYAQVIGGLLNSVIAGFVEQNQAALEQDLQNYEINTNAKKDALTNQLNAGLISRATYDAQIKKLDDKLNADQLAAKKKAFEQDKKLKIAQATIAGLQGAVAAFAGAMQLGPIAGPILGAILAAAVAALTAVQITQIKKQQFDSGGTTTTAADIPTTSSTAAEQITQSSAGGFTSFNQNLGGSPQFTGFGQSGQSSGGMQKVYVVESDITSAQNRVRVLESNASFG